MTEKKYSLSVENYDFCLAINPSNILAIINKGEIAYWPNGNAIAIGYGITPISVANEIRLADNCNIWADTEFNLDLLDNIKGLKKIVIKRVNN